MTKIGRQGEGGGKPLMYKTVEQLKAVVDDYFETEAYIGEGDNRMYAPTMSGLAMHLGMDRRTLLDYSKRDKFLPTIKKARTKIGVALEQRLYLNNVAGIIFNLKNNFNWKDKTELSSDPENPLTLALQEISGNTLEPGGN